MIEAAGGPASNADLLPRHPLDSIANPIRRRLLEVPSGEALRVAGLGVDEVPDARPRRLNWCGNGVRYRAAVRFPRPDVATAYGDQA